MRSIIIIGLLLVGCGEDDKDSVTQAVAAYNQQQQEDEEGRKCPNTEVKEARAEEQFEVFCD